MGRSNSPAGASSEAWGQFILVILAFLFALWVMAQISGVPGDCGYFGC